MINRNLSQKILTVCPNSKGRMGGISVVVYNLMKHFPVVKVLDTVPEKNGKVKLLFFVKVIFKFIYMMVRDRQIELIHIHLASRGSFYRKFFFFLTGKFIFKKKIIIHLHGGGFFSFYKGSQSFIKHLIKFTFNNSDLIIVLSKSLGEKFNEVFPFCRTRVEIIPNFIDINVPVNFLKKSKKFNAKISFLFLGKICREKGLFELIEAVNQSSLIKDNCIFKLAGEGPDTGLVKNLINKYNLDEIISFLGYIYGRDKELAFSDCDVFILPSYTEALPMVIIEAMSAGKAILASNVGGIPDLVKDGINGFLFLPQNSSSIIEAIEKIVINRSLVKKFSIESIAISQQFDSQMVVPLLENEYKKLLVNHFVLE